MVLGDEFSVSETRVSSFTSINEFELVMIWSLCLRHHVMGFGCKLVVFRLQSSSMILDLYWSEFSLVLFWWTLLESSLVFVSFSWFNLHLSIFLYRPLLFNFTFGLLRKLLLYGRIYLFYFFANCILHPASLLCLHLSLFSMFTYLCKGFGF